MRNQAIIVLLICFLSSLSGCSSTHKCWEKASDRTKISERLKQAGYYTSSLVILDNRTIYANKEKKIVTFITDNEEMVEKLLTEKQALERIATDVMGEKVSFTIVHTTQSRVIDR